MIGITKRDTNQGTDLQTGKKITRDLPLADGEAPDAAEPQISRYLPQTVGKIELP